MRINELLLAEFDRETQRSRKALEQVPEGQFDWKPHEKSMIFGYLADLVAIIPTWIGMQISKDELDIAPVASSIKQEAHRTRASLIEALDKCAQEARTALAGASDEHMQTAWKLKAHGQVVQEAPRYAMIQDTLNHWAHHRGQLTVYLRLLGAKVPAIYGPSADDKSF